MELAVSEPKLEDVLQRHYGKRLRLDFEARTRKIQEIDLDGFELDNRVNQLDSTSKSTNPAFLSLWIRISHSLLRLTIDGQC